MLRSGMLNKEWGRDQLKSFQALETIIVKLVFSI